MKPSYDARREWEPLPPERTPGEKLELALVRLRQAHGLIPAGLTGIHAALNVAEDGLRAALVQPPLLEEEDQSK